MRKLLMTTVSAVLATSQAAALAGPIVPTPQIRARVDLAPAIKVAPRCLLLEDSLNQWVGIPRLNAIGMPARASALSALAGVPVPRRSFSVDPAWLNLYRDQPAVLDAPSLETAKS